MLLGSVFFVQLLLCASILAYGAFHPSWLQSFFSSTSYYFILALTLCWFFSLHAAWRKSGISLKDFWQQQKKPLMLTLLATACVFVTVPKYPRVLSDETNLLSVSRNMAFNKKVDNVTEGRWYYERFWPTKSTIEKRPFLFPFFTQLLHVTLGYRPANALILNFFALWGLLFAVFLLLRPYTGNWWAYAGAILALSQPVLCLSATSGNFEVFNTCFVAFSFLSLRWFLAHRSPESFSVMTFTLLMLANIRYESVLFLCVIAAFLLGKGYVKKQQFLSSPLVLAAPAFMMPFLMQRLAMHFVNDGGNAAGHSWSTVFSLRYVQANLASFSKYALGLSGSLGYAGVLNWAGLAALAVLAAMFFRNKGKERMFFLVCLASLAALFFLLLLCAVGINDHPLNGRYYLPILLFLSVMPPLALSALGRGSRQLMVCGLLVSGAIFVYYHPVAMEDKIDNNLLIVREYRFVSKFLAENADKDALVICSRPGQYVVDNRGAVSFSTANREMESILSGYRNHLYSQLFAVQSISYATGKPLSGDNLDPGYQLEPVARMQVASYYLQISKVTPRD